MEDSKTEPGTSDAPVTRSRRLSLRPQWNDNRLSFVLSIRPNAPPPTQTMDITQSPLTQQSRPDVFEPKVVTLYRELFRVRPVQQLKVMSDSDQGSRGL